MKAYWLDTDKPMSAEELAEEGVTHVRLDPRNYQSTLEVIKNQNAYAFEDLVDLASIAGFEEEHFYVDGQMWFVLEGKGVLEIRSRFDRMFRVEMEAGDAVSVPGNRNHRFIPSLEKRLKCLRLFKDKSGLTPFYRSQLAFASMN